MKFNLITTFCSLALVTLAKAQIPITFTTTTTPTGIITFLAVPTDTTITAGPINPSYTTTAEPVVPPEPTVITGPVNTNASTIPITEPVISTLATETTTDSGASIPPPDTAVPSSDHSYPTLSSGSPPSATPSQTPSASGTFNTSDAGNLRSSIFALGVTLIVGMLLF